MQLDPSNARYKQDIFLFNSEIFTPSKWSFVTIEEAAYRFVEFRMGQSWVEDIEYAGLDEHEEVHISSIYFKLATKKHKYDINPYDIMSLLGDMGGLLDIVMALGVILTVSEV